jgi:hypothetical protein
MINSDKLDNALGLIVSRIKEMTIERSQGRRKVKHMVSLPMLHGKEKHSGSPAQDKGYRKPETPANLCNPK